MPDLDVNREVWARTYDWPQQGDEWSAFWGGSDALWFGALLPRIHAHVPAPTILEIAPGYGRWTHYLQHLCERLVLVDMAENCIEHCRQRFAAAEHVEYHVNDGRSLAMVDDGSIDFAFSFDSLVHADPDVLGGYVEQLATKLTPDGVGFVHHSNLGTQRTLAQLAWRIPERQRRLVVRAGLLPDVYAWRSEAMTASMFAAQCDAAGLVVVSQETISWQHGPYLIDALSVIARKGSVHDRPPARLRNPLFGWEARRMRRLYSR